MVGSDSLTGSMASFRISSRTRRRLFFQVISAVWIVILYTSLRMTGGALHTVIMGGEEDTGGQSGSRSLQHVQGMLEYRNNNNMFKLRDVIELEHKSDTKSAEKQASGISKQRVVTKTNRNSNDTGRGLILNGSLVDKHRHEQNSTLLPTLSNATITQKPFFNALLSYGEEGKGIDHLKQTLLHSGNVISHHDFNYILNPVNFCKGGKLLFIVYVHSSPKYLERRKIIRRTWGNPKYHDSIFKVLFVLGSVPGNDDLQQAITKESDRYGDILQEDFIDSYRNLTHKGVAALKWINQFCSTPKYVLKTDDDTFVNTFIYIRYIKSLEKYGTDRNLILCAVWYGMTVLRVGKWSVSMEQYNDTSFPTYCSGCAFTFSMDVARAIHRISYYVPFLWVDDAYITGILPRRIGNVTYRSLGSTYELNSDKLKDKFTGKSWWGYIFASDIHRFDEAQMVWEKILDLFGIKKLKLES